MSKKYAFFSSTLRTIMTSITITMAGNSPNLTTHFHPEIELDGQCNYSCALLDFSTSDSLIVTENNNKFHYQVVLRFRPDQYEFIELPIGVYVFADVASFIEKEMLKRGYTMKLKLDTETMRTTIEVPKNICLDFTKRNSIGRLLGFDVETVCGGKEYKSEHNIPNIRDLTSFRINCDLVAASFHNGVPTHTLHEFTPQVDSNYKIIEQPKNLIYLPLVKRRISIINITVVDQNEKLLNLWGKQISCRIHIKKD